MSNQTEKLPFVDETKIGEYAAQQPVSGVTAISSVATSHGGYAQMVDKTGGDQSIASKRSA